MPGSGAYAWDSMASLAVAVDNADREIMTIRRNIADMSGAAGELVADTHSYAGAPDGQANVKGGQVRRTVVGIAERLIECETLIKALKRQLNEAEGAVDDARAQRSSFGPTLNI